MARPYSSSLLQDSSPCARNSSWILATSRRRASSSWMKPSVEDVEVAEVEGEIEHLSDLAVPVPLVVKEHADGRVVRGVDREALRKRRPEHPHGREIKVRNAARRRNVPRVLASEIGVAVSHGQVVRKRS